MPNQTVSVKLTAETTAKILDLLGQVNDLLPELTENEKIILQSLMKMGSKARKLTEDMILVMREEPDAFPRSLDPDYLSLNLGDYDNGVKVINAIDNCSRKVGNIAMFSGGIAYKGARDGYGIAKKMKLKSTQSINFDELEKSLAKKSSKSKDEDTNV